MLMNILIRTLIIILFLVLAMSQKTIAQNELQATNKCKIQNKAGKYKLLLIDATRDKNGISLFLHVKFKKKTINRVRMTQLADRLFAEYCKANSLLAVIFESKKDAGLSLLSGYISGKPIIARGYFSFDRKKRVKFIEFSTKKGNPTREIQIDLSEAGRLKKEETWKKYFMQTKIAVSPILRRFPNLSRFPIYVRLKSEKSANHLFLAHLRLGAKNLNECLEPLWTKLHDEWVKTHKESIIVEVERGRILEKEGEVLTRSSYVWLLDKDESFNIKLVRKGACKSSVMLVDQEAHSKILVKKVLYDKFMSRILDAERKAKQENLGVWQ